MVEVSRASAEFPGGAGLPPIKYRQGYYTGQTCNKPDPPPKSKPDDDKDDNNNADNGNGQQGGSVKNDL